MANTISTQSEYCSTISTQFEHIFFSETPFQHILRLIGVSIPQLQHVMRKYPLQMAVQRADLQFGCCITKFAEPARVVTIHARNFSNLAVAVFNAVDAYRLSHPCFFSLRFDFPTRILAFIFHPDSNSSQASVVTRQVWV